MGASVRLTFLSTRRLQLPPDLTGQVCHRMDVYVDPTAIIQRVTQRLYRVSTSISRHDIGICKSHVAYPDAIYHHAAWDLPCKEGDYRSYLPSSTTVDVG